MLPRLVMHCDWGCSPSKRWFAKARLQGESIYHISEPGLVGDLDGFLARIQCDAGDDACALVGFDFPIGLPTFYTNRAGILRFEDFLPIAGRGDWAEFYNVAEIPTEISLHRPFYPFRPGGAKQRHLLDALGARSIDDLRRRCELKQPHRKAACPVFWTLGAMQVGKGAIVGWRDVLAPAIRDRRPVSLWPFAGSLSSLFKSGRTIVAETWPGEYYRCLCPTLKGNKEDRGQRTKAGEELLRWVKDNHFVLSAELRASVTNGVPQGSDAFDAIVGLLGMMQVVLGRREPGELEEVREVEGWILGQSPDEGESA